MKTANRSIRPLGVGVLLLGLAACEPSPFEPAAEAPAGPLTIGVGVPPELATRSIEDERLSLVASADGRALTSVRRGDTWELEMTAAPGTTFELELEWCYRDLDDLDGIEGVDDDCPLPLAVLSRPVAVGTSDLRIPIRFDEFRSDFDEDEDGAANYIELRDDFDPRNDNLCPDCRTDVDLTIVRRAERPVIDGSYFNGSGDAREDVWGEAQLEDREGRLAIDTLLQGAGTGIGLSGRENDDQPPKWGAMHDGSDLFLFVLGEGVPKSQRFGADGGAGAADNDSIELFLQTSSRAFRLVIPVADEDGGSNRDEDSDLFLPSGADGTGSRDAIDYATCTCENERDFYELRISLDWLGVGSGDVIGIEVQINDDDDGGAVDERWGWRAEPGSGRDVDSGSSDGSLPGRALLQ